MSARASDPGRRRTFGAGDPRLLAGAAVAMLALAGGVLSAVAVEPLAGGCLCFREDPVLPCPLCDEVVRLACVGISTTILLALALGFGISRRRHAVLATIGACTALGWLNCPASLLLDGLASGEPFRSTAGSVFLGAIFGLPFGAPLGLLYGLVCAVPARRLRRLLDRPTLADGAEATVAVAATVFVSAGMAVAVAAGRLAPVVPPSLPGALALAALAVLVLAALRVAWFRRLALDPQRSGHERVSLADLDEAAAELPPLHGGVSPTASHALVRLGEAGAGAYRVARTRRPLALID